MRSGRSPRWLGLAGLGGFLILLELAPRAGLVPERYLPPASRIAGALAGELGQPSFWAALGDTLAGWAIGLAVAVAGGIAPGRAAGQRPGAADRTSSTIEFCAPSPRSP